MAYFGFVVLGFLAAVFDDLASLLLLHGTSLFGRLVNGSLGFPLRGGFLDGNRLLRCWLLGRSRLLRCWFLCRLLLTGSSLGLLSAAGYIRFGLRCGLCERSPSQSSLLLLLLLLLQLPLLDDVLALNVAYRLNRRRAFSLSFITSHRPAV